MDCNQALEYISAALDGELTAEEVAELDAHLADCPECQALAEEFGILSVALSDMEEVPPPDLAEQIKTRLDPAPPVSLNAARRKIHPNPILPRLWRGELGNLRLKMLQSVDVADIITAFGP